MLLSVLSFFSPLISFWFILTLKPRAISAGVGGGIKRVAGSLAVTRALGDAYLKTPLLSFLPYKSHAPYITARPEVNCRP